MACCAIVACNEPKVASAASIKSYITEYHPEFKVDKRPFRFKNALEKAEASQLLR
jgi:hypothetical protein